MTEIDQLSPDFISAYARWSGLTYGEARMLLELEPLVDITDEQVQTAAAWDESKHPRHPAGTEEGGEFAPKWERQDDGSYAAEGWTITKEHSKGSGQAKAFERVTRKAGDSWVVRDPGGTMRAQGSTLANAKQNAKRQIELAQRRSEVAEPPRTQVRIQAGDKLLEQLAKNHTETLKSLWEEDPRDAIATDLDLNNAPTLSTIAAAKQAAYEQSQAYLRRQHPSGTVVLYRGGTGNQGREVLPWTPDRSEALRFAGGDPANMQEREVAIEDVLAALPAFGHAHEREYLLPRELLGAAWDESKHPRHPSGTEKGGEFAPKGAKRGQAHLELDRKPTAEEIDAVLNAVPLDGGPVDFGPFTVEKLTDNGEEFWEFRYAKENPDMQGDWATHQWHVGDEDPDKGGGTPALRRALENIIERETHGKGFMREPGWKGPRGQTWADVEALGPSAEAFYGSLTQPEYGALARWTSDEYKAWNEAIRDPTQLDGQEKLVLNRMERVFRKVPDLPPMVVYRGATVPGAAKPFMGYSEPELQEELADTLARFQPGSRLQLAGGGYQAATPNLETAQQFGRTIFRITNPRRGIQTSPVSWQPKEGEVLLDRHETYVVTGMKLITMWEGSPNEHKRVMVDVEYRD